MNTEELVQKIINNAGQTYDGDKVYEPEDEAELIRDLRAYRKKGILEALEDVFKEANRWRLVKYGGGKPLCLTHLEIDDLRKVIDEIIERTDEQEKEADKEEVKG